MTSRWDKGKICDVNVKMTNLVSSAAACLGTAARSTAAAAGSSDLTSHLRPPSAPHFLFLSSAWSV